MCKECMKYKLLFLGLFFLLVGAAFLFLENTFYQFADESGLLHESLFLPLGILALILGALLLFIFVAKKVVQSVRMRSS